MKTNIIYKFHFFSSLTRLIFPKSDDNLLEYCQEENLTVEPKWFEFSLELIVGFAYF